MLKTGQPSPASGHGLTAGESPSSSWASQCTAQALPEAHRGDAAPATGTTPTSVVTSVAGFAWALGGCLKCPGDNSLYGYVVSAKYAFCVGN
jgi:hypothetical protein